MFIGMNTYHEYLQSDVERMDFVFLFYIFISIVVIAGGAFSFYSRNQIVAAGIIFVGLTVASVVFGLRWFTGSGSLKGGSNGTWPPSINYCPDFLTLSKVNGQPVCIDTVGVSRSGMAKTTDVVNQTDEKYLFHLFTDKTGPERVKLLCDQCANKKVTWEGVWDGSLCIGREPPLPPKQTIPGAAAPSS